MKKRERLEALEGQIKVLENSVRLRRQIANNLRQRIGLLEHQVEEESEVCPTSLNVTLVINESADLEALHKWIGAAARRACRP